MAQLKEEESKKSVATKAQAQAEKKAKETLNCLTEREKPKKSAKAVVAEFERQAQEQRGHL